MKDSINFYFALLIMVIAGSIATLIIVHVAYSSGPETLLIGSEANYKTLQQSILKQ